MARQSLYLERRAQLLDVLYQGWREGRAITVRSLAQSLGAGVATTHDYLNKLREEEMVSWQNKRIRTLHLTQRALALLGQGESNLVAIGAAQDPRLVAQQSTVKATRTFEQFADVGF